MIQGREEDGQGFARLCDSSLYFVAMRFVLRLVCRREGGSSPFYGIYSAEERKIIASGGENMKLIR